MRVPLRIFFAACVAVVLVVVVALSGTRQSTSRDLSTKPERSQAPAGYDAFEAASDATFAKAIADQVSALGNDPETGGRTAGSPAEREAAQLLEQTMKDIGLQNVTVDEVSADSWVFKGASLSFIGADGETQHATLGGYQTDLVVNGRSFPVMDLGRGTAADYKGKDVRDKLVLIDVDMENDWWINYPAMQAKQMGAKAVLAVGVMAAPGRDRLVSQDICGPADAPVLSISEGDAARIREALRANGRGKGKARQINATLYADSRVGEGDTTQNVWGEIPGNTDDVILFTAHYDGYYHAFFDDAIGVGLILDMAKSFVESGYVPEKTLRFIVHGAEEWGKADSEADWAIGAWRQVSEARPDWPGKIFALVNLDSAYPLAPMQSFSLSVPYELRNFAGQAVSAFGDRSALRIDADGELPSPYREDFSYNALGVPTFASEGGEGDEEYFASMYHSSMDTSEVGGFSEDAAKGIMRFFGFTTFLLDRTPVRPLTFSPRIEALQATVDAAEEAGLRVDPHLSANIERAGIAATAIDGIVRGINQDYSIALLSNDTATLAATVSQAAVINPLLYNLYGQIQGGLLRLDWGLAPAFGNEVVQQRILLLEKAIASLEAEDAQAALDGALYELDLSALAADFDQATCDYFNGRFLPSLVGTWAEGRTVGGLCVADRVVRSLLGKIEAEEAAVPTGVSGSAATASQNRYSEEIAELRELLTGQNTLLSAVYQEQAEMLALIIDDMNTLLDVTGTEGGE